MKKSILIMTGLLLLVAGMALGCRSEKGLDDTGVMESETEASVDSCWFGEDVCIEYDGVTRNWCDEMASQYSLSDIIYSPDPCPILSCVGRCATSPVGDLEANAVIYYYGPSYDASDAEFICMARSCGGNSEPYETSFDPSCE